MSECLECPNNVWELRSDKQGCDRIIYENCDVPADDNKKCDKCEDYFSWNGTACAPCDITKCLKCDNFKGIYPNQIANCTVCEPEFVFEQELLADDSVRQICEWPEPIKYCEFSDLNDVENCLQCESHYFFNKTTKQCELCTNAIHGCLECNNEGLFCYKCFEDYGYDFFENTCYEHNCVDSENLGNLYTFCYECESSPTEYFLHMPSGRCYEDCTTLNVDGAIFESDVGDGHCIRTNCDPDSSLTIGYYDGHFYDNYQKYLPPLETSQDCYKCD